MASSSRPARARYLSSIVPTSLIPEKSGNHSECSSYFCWGPIGRSRPIRLSTLDNRVSPTRPVAARRRYSDRKEGDGGGGRGCRRKRRLRCNGGDRAARAGIPNLKGCRLPAGLSGAMRLGASTDGDVRRRKLNEPKDGCRMPPVRRNQDRMLRAAGDLFPTAEA